MAQSHEGKSTSALYATLTRKWDPNTVESFAKALEQSDAVETKATAAAFQTIDAKATGLLTHVSMMIAGLGICMPLLAQHWLEEAVIIAEISVYLLIAVGCLRCLSIVHSLPQHGSGIDLRQTVQRELVIRHELYRLCNQASIYFTTAVFLSLPVLWWIRPES
jgi:hypothetical protein